MKIPNGRFSAKFPLGTDEDSLPVATAEMAQMMAGSGSMETLASFWANVCSGSDLRINQTPEPVFATMFLLEFFNELQVRRVVAVIHDRRVAGLTFG